MAALRPLLTATAAGGLLAALWFVPSANATVEVPERTGQSAGGPTRAQQAADDSQAATTATSASASTASAASAEANLALADTGSVDTTPYVIGGTAFLGVGAGFVAYSVRRRGAAAGPAYGAGGAYGDFA